MTGFSLFMILQDGITGGMMIKRFLEMAKDYLKQAGERKIRLVVAVLVSAALFAVSSVYLYEGFNKRLIIYTLLSLGTGALIVLPRLKRWYVSCPVVLLYVLMVPQKLFQRIELPVHNMEKLLGGYFCSILCSLFLSMRYFC